MCVALFLPADLAVRLQKPAGREKPHDDVRPVAMGLNEKVLNLIVRVVRAVRRRVRPVSLPKQFCSGS
jgi:hypothetical protein